MNKELKKKSEISKEYLKKFSSKDYIFKNSVKQIKEHYRDIS